MISYLIYIISRIVCIINHIRIINYIVCIINYIKIIHLLWKNYNLNNNTSNVHNKNYRLYNKIKKLIVKQIMLKRKEKKERERYWEAKETEREWERWRSAERERIRGA
jgi:hypothetical protein